MIHDGGTLPNNLRSGISSKIFLNSKVSPLKDPIKTLKMPFLILNTLGDLCWKFYTPFSGTEKVTESTEMFINNDYPDGGAKMIDIDSFSKYLKATWIKKYLDEENKS